MASPRTTEVTDRAATVTSTVAPAPPARFPRWFVTTRHRVPASAPRSEQHPYGLQHARQVGSSVTACGIPATDWNLFWNRPFNSRIGACEDCVLHIVSSA